MEKRSHTDTRDIVYLESKKVIWLVTLVALD
jgi:hypothetical protein